MLKQQIEESDLLNCSLLWAHMLFFNANRHLSGLAGRTILNTISKMGVFPHMQDLEERWISQGNALTFTHYEWNEF